ncbi:DNA polymerase Y family protein [Pendulispora brunnea]|uniref:DNA polymerase Y family protein n=1 Tax=Pendulispora brunnea TaxID=2905690 RepID=A0ABZ2KNS7_9BACT
MRVAAIHLPEVRLELARGRLAPEQATGPLAVVIARPGGTITDESSLLGNTRLDHVAREVRACGIRPGDTIASARARNASLLVRVVAEHEVRSVLETVAEAALAYGRPASIDERYDVVYVDVTGAAHLFGGEVALGTALRDRVRDVHHAARVAIADGPRVAAAVAQHARKTERVCVVPPEGNAVAIHDLPLRALPVDEADRAWLENLGLRCVGDLQRLPPRGLAVRLGAAHAEVMALLAGDDRAPLVPYEPPEVPEERAELEYGIEHTEQLMFVVKRLCDRLAARLAGRAMATTTLELVLSLDRALCRDRGVPPSASLTLTLPTPVAGAGELFAVARARAEAWTIEAPILAVALRATDLARKNGVPLDLFVAEARAERTLPRLVAELSANLGDGCVGVLSIANTWVPEEQTRLVPYAERSTIRPWVSPSPAPTRLLASPIILADGYRPVRTFVRLEAVQWWRCGIRGRDFIAAWHADERRMAWIARDRESGQALLYGWMD